VQLRCETPCGHVTRQFDHSLEYILKSQPSEKLDSKCENLTFRGYCIQTGGKADFYNTKSMCRLHQTFKLLPDITEYTNYDS
jgi:hypothetical protein